MTYHNPVKAITTKRVLLFLISAAIIFFSFFIDVSGFTGKFVNTTIGPLTARTYSCTNGITTVRGRSLIGLDGNAVQCFGYYKMTKKEYKDKVDNIINNGAKDYNLTSSP